MHHESGRKRQQAARNGLLVSTWSTGGSDWARWEALGRAPASGEGNGFGTRYAEDFALLAEHGLTHHRLSIEWAIELRSS